MRWTRRQDGSWRTDVGKWHATIAVDYSSYPRRSAWQVWSGDDLAALDSVHRGTEDTLSHAKLVAEFWLSRETKRRMKSRAQASDSCAQCRTSLTVYGTVFSYCTNKPSHPADGM